MMKKIFKVIPIVVFMKGKEMRVWMEGGEREGAGVGVGDEEGEFKRDIGNDLRQRVIQQSVIPVQEQQSKPKQQQSSNQQQSKPQDDRQIIQQDRVQQKVQQVTEQKQQKVEQVHQITLNQNQAVINDKCPPHIFDFLQKTNFKIHHQKNSSSDLTIKNSKGDIFTLNMHKIIQQNKDELQLLNNFINPPQEITTIQQAKELLTLQQKDTFYIVSYLPKQEEYEQQIKNKTKSIYDSYTLSRKVNLSQLQNKYTALAYNSSSNKNTYLIIRNKQVANYLRINNFHIGVPYIINKTSKQNGNQSNNQWQGNQYYMTNLNKQWRDQIDHQIINKSTHFYINKIVSEADAFNKIRQMQMAGDKRKVLLVYTNQREQFQNQMQEILQKVARTQKNNVVVIKSENQRLLKTIFKVQPEQYTTIRLFDVNKLQTPLFSQSKESNCFSRYQYKGPFKYENLCNFVKDNNLPQYYQNKKTLTFIKTVSPNQLKKLDNTLVLLEKEGCQSCKYVQGNLDELKKVKKVLQSANSKLKQNVIYRYNIQEPSTLHSLKIRRYSIFNESLEFVAPPSTPKLYIFSQGKYLDLNIGESLQKLKTIKQSQLNDVNSFVLKDIINKIRRSDNLAFTDI